MAKKRTSVVPAAETKSQKAVRLGNKRVGSAVKYLRLVGNLAGKGYEFTPEQRAMIVQTVTDATADVVRRFSGEDSKADGFDLAKAKVAT